MKIKSENRVNAKMVLKDRFPENVMSDGQQGFMDHSIRSSGPSPPCLSKRIESVGHFEKSIKGSETQISKRTF